MKKVWKNWSGIVKFKPKQVAMPASEQDIITTIKESYKAGQNIRIVGSAHSWTPLYETSDTLICLDNLQGITHVDYEKHQVTVLAGTKIKKLGELLYQHGMGMENLGDIDVQSIGGAIGTGTHGTGIEFGNIPTQVVAFEIITANGKKIYCSETVNRHIFKAAQISLGALGIIATITLQCVPAYKLHYRSDKETIDSCLANLEHYINSNRNFEFYWFPHTQTVQTKFSNISQQPAQERSVANYVNDLLIENVFFGSVSATTRIFPKLSPVIAKLVANFLSPFEKINWSHKVYATIRKVQFNEMEYNIPIEQFRECFQEIRDAFEYYNFKVHFPLEIRFLKEDDIYLSPAYGRNSVHISFHVLNGKNYTKYFDVMEKICLKYQGRPHWGKLHTLTADQLSKLYPKWNDFITVRNELDPTGLFFNGYLRQLLGIYSNNDIKNTTNHPATELTITKND